MAEREGNTNNDADLIRDYDPAKAAERLHHQKLALEEKLRRIEEAQFVGWDTMNLMFAPCAHHQPVIRDESGHIVDLDNNKHLQ